MKHGWAGLVATVLSACGGGLSTPSDPAALVADAGSEAGANTNAVPAKAPDDGGGVADAGHPLAMDAAVSGFGACFPDAGGVSQGFKTCHADDECTFARHVTSCCGSVQWIGVRIDHEHELATCEAEWDQHFPRCGCGSGPPTTEDGNTVAWGEDGGSIAVHCIMQANAAIGACTTSKL
jgi:hypothetical protein